MKHVEITSCYCFNPLCGKSIFEERNDIAVFYPLEKVLSGPLCCEECNAELVSKPALEMQKQIHTAVLSQDLMGPLLVTNEQILTLI